MKNTNPRPPLSKLGETSPIGYVVHVPHAALGSKYTMASSVFVISVDSGRSSAWPTYMYQYCCNSTSDLLVLISCQKCHFEVSTVSYSTCIICCNFRTKHLTQSRSITWITWNWYQSGNRRGNGIRTCTLKCSTDLDTFLHVCGSATEIKDMQYTEYWITECTTLDCLRNSLLQ